VIFGILGLLTQIKRVTERQQQGAVGQPGDTAPVVGIAAPQRLSAKDFFDLFDAVVVQAPSCKTGRIGRRRATGE
jgi:hypothetical protein